MYLFMKASFSPDVILCGSLGLKHQLNNYLLRQRDTVRNFDLHNAPSSTPPLSGYAVLVSYLVC